MKRSAEKDSERWRISCHDGNFQLDAGDDYDFSEGVGEISHLLEFEKDCKAKYGNQNHYPAERDDAEEHQSFAEGYLDCPERLNGENNDTDIGKDVLRWLEMRAEAR